LRRGMNRPLTKEPTGQPLAEATPFIPLPMLRPSRPRQLQTSRKAA
jgi:hypothetical protein